jgi:ABC-type transport system involved in cytochrome c biogenesis permease component
MPPISFSTIHTNRCAAVSIRVPATSAIACTALAAAAQGDKAVVSVSACAATLASMSSGKDSMSAASARTMLSAIASKAGNSNMLMPVLSLPVIIPLLLILIKACKRAMDGTDPSQILKDLVVLFIFNTLIIGMAYMLFPSLWKE